MVTLPGGQSPRGQVLTEEFPLWNHIEILLPWATLSWIPPDFTK